MTYMCATRWLYLAVILAVSGVARPQVEGTRTVANTSAADGARNLSNESPALTGERRPQYRLHKSDVVEIRSQHGSIRASAVVSPGLAPDVIAMPVGQGHETFTRYASGRGANPVGILAPVTEPETGTLAWAATRVQISRVGRDTKQLTLFAGEMREHPYGHAR